MTRDFFTQLEAELGSRTHAGMHLDGGHGHRRAVILGRRAGVVIALAVALAASLDSEFPATAQAPAAHVWVVPAP